MAAPEELSMDSIRQFMLSRGGVVTNHDLVRHFKYFLTNDESKVHAKMHFKEYVNTLAHISKTENGDKFLTLKPRYLGHDLQSPGFRSPPMAKSMMGPSSPNPSISGSMLSFSAISQENLLESPGRVPPPYRAPPPPGASPRSSPGAPPPYIGPPPVYRTVDNDSPPSYRQVEGQEADFGGMPPPPPVPPRRRSSDKGFGDLGKENMALGVSQEVPMEVVMRSQAEGQEDDVEPLIKKEGSTLALEKEPEAKISVKERTQKFNRMASEGELRPALHQINKKKVDKGADEEEARPLDEKDREWLVKASQVDYHALAKLAAERPKLVNLRDPCVSYNALHWAAKHGNQDVTKLIAGTYHVNPNVKSRGGMTPLHLAVQFGHDDVRDLLIHYGADSDIRDYSGKKPMQYERAKSNSESTETIHKIKSRKKHSDKDLGFLRIGSLNVRVKKTTEAFSNFFHHQNNERIHKTWGSADNVQESDQNAMPPPKTLPKSGSKRRRPRRSPSAASIQVVSTPVPVSIPMSAMSLEHINLKSNQRMNPQDSDSDNACGFGDSWK